MALETNEMQYKLVKTIQVRYKLRNIHWYTYIYCQLTRSVFNIAELVHASVDNMYPLKYTAVTFIIFARKVSPW